MFMEIRQQDTAVLDIPRKPMIETGRGLSHAIRRIHLDSKQDARRYLEEVVTPFGGE